VENKKRACINCIHYYVTWDRDFPCGCKGYGFKSQEEPRVTVRKTSGQECLMFEEKAGKTET
jgi:hypothetical protein